MPRITCPKAKNIPVKTAASLRFFGPTNSIPITTAITKIPAKVHYAKMARNEHTWMGTAHNHAQKGVQYPIVGNGHAGAGHDLEDNRNEKHLFSSNSKNCGHSNVILTQHSFFKHKRFYSLWKLKNDLPVPKESEDQRSNHLPNVVAGLNYGLTNMRSANNLPLKHFIK